MIAFGIKSNARTLNGITRTGMENHAAIGGAQNQRMPYSRATIPMENRKTVEKSSPSAFFFWINAVLKPPITKT